MTAPDLSPDEATIVARFEETPAATAETEGLRRVKRRYAHKLYPHADEWQTRPLADEVPYLYAQAIGWETSGTGWMDLFDRGQYREANYRIHALIDAQRLALLADALHQGMTGDEAWAWADRHDVAGEWVWERAAHYGVDPDQIKPYPCGPEPEHHDHYGPKDTRGGQRVTRVQGRESDCLGCTEPDVPLFAPGASA